MIRWILASGLAVLFLSGCRMMPTQHEEKSVNDLFAITLPDYLEPVSELNEDAQVQFASKARDVYLIIRYNTYGALNAGKKKPGTFNAEDYYDFHIENLLMDVSDPEAPGPKVVSLNGLKALKGYFKGNHKGDQLYYYLVMIEGQKHFYQVLLWTTQENLPLYQQDMEQIIASFRELTAPPTRTEETQSDQP